MKYRHPPPHDSSDKHLSSLMLKTTSPKGSSRGRPRIEKLVRGGGDRWYDARVSKPWRLTSVGARKLQLPLLTPSRLPTQRRRQNAKRVNEAESLPPTTTARQQQTANHSHERARAEGEMGRRESRRWSRKRRAMLQGCVEAGWRRAIGHWPMGAREPLLLSE